jgi:hypothetical protein
VALGRFDDLHADEWLEPWADVVASRWSLYWPAIQVLTDETSNDDGVHDLAQLLAAAADRHPAVEAALVDAFESAGRQLRSLIGQSLHGELVREGDSIECARRAVERLGRPAVVAAYIRHMHLDDGDRRLDQWAWNIVNDLVEDAAESWPMILDLVAAADDDEVLGLVGV